eukprot:m.83081 g.83081  ORF g.83081 m.83081 type:complete len:1379 (+) comp36330_c0_seq5:480-4616(+)
MISALSSLVLRVRELRCRPVCSKLPWSMASLLPIKYRDCLQLQDVGIKPDNIGFASLTLESDKFICVRERVGDQFNLVIVDLADPSRPRRLQTSADCAIMNPKSMTIAVKSGLVLQILDIKTKSKVKSHKMDIGQYVVFWTWISEDTVALVTQTSVYHWSMENDALPQKKFNRHGTLSHPDCQLINYHVDKAQKWLLLMGILLKENTYEGTMQLFSVEKKASQQLNGSAAAFTQFTGKMKKNPVESTLLAFAVGSSRRGKLRVVELGKARSHHKRFKKPEDIVFSPGDFPFALHISDRYDVIFLVTKHGYVHLYHLETGDCIYRGYISSQTILATAMHNPSSGVIGVNKRGQVFTISVDDENVLPFITNVLHNSVLALRMAARSNLAGAEELFLHKFNKLFQQRRYLEAAQVAATAPKGFMRSSQTVRRFLDVSSKPGQSSPLLQYVDVLLERGPLDKAESVEVCRFILQLGKKDLAEKWLKEEKLKCTEELGDSVMPEDVNLALTVYLRANVPNKVIQCFAETGQLREILPYTKRNRLQPNYISIMRNMVKTSPNDGLAFASMLVQEKLPVDVNSMIDVFVKHSLIKHCISFLLDILKDNLPSEERLQTRLLEINLRQSSEVTEATLSDLIHNDRARIAILCEEAGLLQKALEYYTNLVDIKRVIVRTDVLNSEWLINYFGSLSAEDILELLQALLQASVAQNLQICVSVATKYHNKLSTVALIELFESFKLHQGLFSFLGSLIDISQEPVVHLKYIQAACKTGRMKEAERICRESNFYDPCEVKDFLKEAHLTEQLPLIIVCDRFNFVDDLILYLSKNRLEKYIEIYIQKVNPSRLPEVVGNLLDAGYFAHFIEKLIMCVPSKFSADGLVQETEKRNRLKILLPWLETRIHSNSSELVSHKAIVLFDNAIACTELPCSLPLRDGEETSFSEKSEHSETKTVPHPRSNVVQHLVDSTLISQLRSKCPQVTASCCVLDDVSSKFFVFLQGENAADIDEAVRWMEVQRERVSTCQLVFDKEVESVSLMHVLKSGRINIEEVAKEVGVECDMSSLPQGILEVASLSRDAIYAFQTNIEKSLEKFFQESTIQRDDIEFNDDTDFISAGGRGEVYKARVKKTGETAALKVLYTRRRSLDESKVIGKEAIILLGIKPHPNIVKFIGVCNSPRFFALLMEFVSGGDLAGLLASSYPEVEKWENRLDISNQIAMGMAHLHGNSPPVIHLDLKSRNVLIEKKADRRRPFLCKICDFDVAKMTNVSSITQDRSNGSKPAGTVAYLAPERYHAYGPGSKEEKTEVAKKSDVFSYGVVLWEIRERLYPYNDMSNEAIRLLVKSGDRLPQGTANAPHGYNKLIKDCSAFHPAERPLFNEVLERLKEILAI